jgi:hypothetical protein
MSSTLWRAAEGLFDVGRPQTTHAAGASTDKGEEDTSPECRRKARDFGGTDPFLDTGRVFALI